MTSVASNEENAAKKKTADKKKDDLSKKNKKKDDQSKRGKDCQKSQTVSDEEEVLLNSDLIAPEFWPENFTEKKLNSISFEVHIRSNTLIIKSKVVIFVCSGCHKNAQNAR